MFGNLDYHGMGGAVESLWKGQKRAEESMMTDSTIASQEAQRKALLDRLTMDQELHPEKLKEAGLRNTGYDLENQQKKVKLNDAQKDQQKTAVGNYFRYIANNIDPDQAAVMSGVNPGLAEKFKQLREQKPDQFAEIGKKVNEQWAQSDDKSIQAEASAKAQFDRTTAKSDADYRRATGVEQMRQDGQDRRQRAMLEARMAMQGKIESARQQIKNPQQLIAILQKEKIDLINNPNVPIESKSAMIEVLDQNINSTAVMIQAIQPVPPKLDIPGAAAGRGIENLPPRVAAPPANSNPGLSNPANVPTGARPQMTPADQQAAAWAQQNQNDPRAASIIQKLKQEGKL